MPSVSSFSWFPAACHLVYSALHGILYQDDVRVTERTCRTVRFAIRCIGIQSSSLLEPLVTQLVGLYEAKGHSCYLYLGSILVDEYASEQGCIPGLLAMLQAFISPAYRLLAPKGSLKEHPDTVDDFFRLNARFLQRAPMPYLQVNVICVFIMSINDFNYCDFRPRSSSPSWSAPCSPQPWSTAMPTPL